VAVELRQRQPHAMPVIEWQVPGLEITVRQQSLRFLIASPGLFPLFLLPVVFAFVEDFFGLLADLVFLARFSHLAAQ